MKIILLEDVKSQGKKGDVLTVSDGFARNLISRKQALEATPKNLNDLKLQMKHADKVAAENLAEAQALAKRMEDMSITVSLKVGEGGRTFGSISTKEIAQAIKEQLSLDIDKHKLVLNEGIKALGAYEVPVKLHPQVTGTMRVKVVEGK